MQAVAGGDEHRDRRGYPAEGQPAEPRGHAAGMGPATASNRLGAEHAHQERCGRIGGQNIVGQFGGRRGEGPHPHTDPDQRQPQSVGDGRGFGAFPDPPQPFHDRQRQIARPGKEAHEHRQRVEQKAAAVIFHRGGKPANVVDQEETGRPLA